MHLNSIKDIIEDIRQGKMVVLMDDEDRENEGDLVMAASMVRPDDINFMVKEARGLVCLTLTKERCKQLNLTRMVDANDSVYGTNFTASIEAAAGVTTGISAADRALTIQAAVAPQAQPRDIVQPGHIFPIMAQPGGVLSRAGHTEASTDLARMAGLESAAAIVEILNEDGTMARRPDLEVFAKKHSMKIGTIDALIQYRLVNETTVEKVKSREVQTLHGTFDLHTYKDTARNTYHHALVKGEWSETQDVLTRVHLVNPLKDLFALTPSEQEQTSQWTVQSSLAHIAKEGSGVLVVLGFENLSSSGVEKKLQSVFGETDKITTNNNEQTMQVGVGSQILRDLGVRNMRLMGAPIKYTGIAGFDLQVVEHVLPE